MNLELGDNVKWRIAEAGTTRYIRGVVYAEVPGGIHPALHLRGKMTKTHLCRFNSMQPRPHPSFVIEVHDPSRKARPQLHWPRKSQLERDV